MKSNVMEHLDMLTLKLALHCPITFKNWSTKIRNILIEIGQGHISGTLNISYDKFSFMAEGSLIDLYVTDGTET